MLQPGLLRAVPASQAVPQFWRLWSNPGTQLVPGTLLPLFPSGVHNALSRATVLLPWLGWEASGGGSTRELRINVIAIMK